MADNNSINSETKPGIYVVSGGKGLAGTNVVRSVLIQFPGQKVRLRVIPDINSSEKVLEAVQKVKSKNGIIVHTMVNPHIRKELINECEKNNVQEFDIVGSLSDHLADVLNTEPISKPGLFRLSNIEYFRRVEAIEFTMKCDDGMNSHKINNADIILTGVSRTGKTPLSIYLGMFGWKVANVPLVMGIAPPEELFTIDSNRVFGLTTSTNYLIAQRSNRVRELGLSDGDDYIIPRKVKMELDYAKMIFEKHEFYTLKITNRPIETSANEITNELLRRFGREGMRK